MSLGSGLLGALLGGLLGGLLWCGLLGDVLLGDLLGGDFLGVCCCFCYRKGLVFERWQFAASLTPTIAVFTTKLPQDVGQHHTFDQ